MLKAVTTVATVIGLVGLAGAALAATATTPAAPAGGADPLMEQARQHFKAIPAAIPAVKDNAVTREKIELGKMLFFEPRLSASGIFSCNSCHNLGLGGVDGLETSVGHGWQKGPRNSPTVLNAVLNVAQFWDGRAEDLKAQAKGPIQANVEMNATPEHVLGVLNSIPAYPRKFADAFPNERNPVTFDNVAKAIEAFEATLTTPAAPFDQYLEGKADALTDQQKKGLSLFMDKGCVGCHTGVNVGGHDYFPFGVVQKPGAEILPPTDKGRFAVTKTADDEYVFRSPTLRNVALTAPYFHTGKVWDLRQAVGIMGTAQLGATLSEPEIDAITAFLHSLTGQQPRVEYPMLPASTVATPKPVLR
ncbi:cytochrome-c peroxidase [Azospirillum sp.]|uniref:cytochrome-c peroxidase n=1 Tax=Azospirillum sp. TaxID=34012 RepID=UPI002D4420AB|nr:cytochrome-c peroxidase [Azospirillum sp.]HYD66526.1 cytochrome-c peroxidase [Azospirillum sp.]